MSFRTTPDAGFRRRDYGLWCHGTSRGTTRIIGLVVSRLLHDTTTVWFPVPGFFLELLLGEMAGPLVLDGQRMVPQKLLQNGFSFRFETLRPALEELLKD